MEILEAIGNLHIINVVLCALIGVVFTLWFIPRILVVSFKKKLFDFADERKVHTGVVPRLGGVAFVPSILISVSLMAGIIVGFAGRCQCFCCSHSSDGFWLMQPDSVVF